MQLTSKDTTLVALFVALTASGAFIKIPVGPAPITLQFFFSALAGICLGPLLGLLSQLVYLTLGLLGLPIFTAGGGPAYIFHPTFGYLIGFSLGTFTIGRIAGVTNKPTFQRLLGACFLGILIIYAVGVPYMYLILRFVARTPISFPQVLVSGFLVFLPGDIAKSIGAASVGVKIVPLIKRNQIGATMRDRK